MPFSNPFNISTLLSGFHGMIRCETDTQQQQQKQPCGCVHLIKEKIFL